MTAQQRDMIDQILRSAPFDLGGDVPAEIERGVAEDLVDHVALLGGHCRSFHRGAAGRVPRRLGRVIRFRLALI